VRINHLDELNKERAKICNRYLEGIKNTSIELPKINSNCKTVWHQFVVRVRSRENFIEYLKSKEIGTIIHYPIPPHLSEAYAYLGFKKGDYPITEDFSDTVLSLPLYNGMTDEEQNYVIDVINAY